jgi:hypothetical protein
MKKVKNLSAKTIYSLLSFVLGINILMIGINIGLLIYSFFSSRAIDPFAKIPIQLNFQKQLQWSGIIDTHGSLLMFDSFHGVKIFLSFCHLFMSFGGVNVIILLRKIIKSVIAGDPFTPQNGKRLKWMAMIIFFLPLVIQLFSWIVTKQVISQLQFPTIAIGFDFLDNGILKTYIITSIFLFVISEVFRIGTSLKEEQELTV